MILQFRQHQYLSRVLDLTQIQDELLHDKTRIFESLVSLAYGARHYFDDNYIRIRMKFKFEVPKSYSKKKRIDALEGKIRPTKADIDNYIKSVLDGLNGKAFKDDRYIYAILAEKEYSEEACIEVSIENVEGD